jgi:hypothetical protein
MISYTDFDFAIARWKARAGGAGSAAAEPASGMVQAEVPVATAPELPSDSESESGAVAAEETPITDSGLVLSESLPDPLASEPEDPNV